MIDLREALSVRRILPQFPVVEPARQEARPLELGINPIKAGPRDQGGTTEVESTEGSQTAGEEEDVQLQLRRAKVTLAQLGTTPAAP